MATVLALGLSFGEVAMAKSGGSASGQVLGITTGGRAAGMGGASTAVSDDVSSIFHNPAGLAEAGGMQATAMYQRWIGESNFAILGLSKEIPSAGTFGLGLLYLGLPETEAFDEFGQSVGSFSMSDMALSASWGRALNAQMRVGTTLRMLKETLDTDTASGFSADLSGIYEMPSGLRIGLVAKNLGTGIKYLNESSPQAARIQAGVAAPLLQDRLLGALDIHQQFDDDMEAKLGFEYQISKMAALRAGYAHELGGRELDGITGLSGGFGLNFGSLQFDYAVTPWGDLGLVHLVNLTVTTPELDRAGHGHPSPKGAPLRTNRNRAAKKLTKAMLAPIVQDLKARRGEEALAALSVLLQDFPREPSLYYYAGVAHRILKNGPASREAFQKTYDLAPEGSKLKDLSSKALK